LDFHGLLRLELRVPPVCAEVSLDTVKAAGRRAGRTRDSGRNFHTCGYWTIGSGFRLRPGIPASTVSSNESVVAGRAQSARARVAVDPARAASVDCGLDAHPYTQQARRAREIAQRSLREIHVLPEVRPE
jgi:hypothetical protein